jgi:hypothetical protein
MTLCDPARRSAASDCGSDYCGSDYSGFGYSGFGYSGFGYSGLDSEVPEQAATMAGAKTMATKERPMKKSCIWIDSPLWGSCELIHTIRMTEVTGLLNSTKTWFQPQQASTLSHISVRSFPAVAFSSLRSSGRCCEWRQLTSMRFPSGSRKYREVMTPRAACFSYRHLRRHALGEDMPLRRVRILFCDQVEISRP